MAFIFLPPPPTATRDGLAAIGAEISAPRMVVGADGEGHRKCAEFHQTELGSLAHGQFP